MLLLIFLIWCQLDRWMPSGSMSTCLISGNSCLMSASSLRAHRALIRPAAIRGNQGQLEAIRGDSRQSDAITPVNLGAQEDAVELVDREEEGLCLDGGLG